VHGQAEWLGELAELGDDVLPLAHAQVVEVLGAAEAAEGRGAEVPLLGAQVAPEVQVGEEVRGGVGEAAVELVRLGLLLHRALTHVLDRECRHDDEGLGGAAVAASLQEHAAEARVDGEGGELPADGGEGGAAVGGCARPAVLQRPDLDEQVDAVADRARVRGIHEREAGHVPQAEGGHLQDDRRERGTQDLRLGELGAGLVVRLRVEADRDSVRHAAAPARALVRGRLRDGLDGEALHLGTGGEAGDAGGARVDDVADAGHRQRGLRHVGGEHDAADRVRLEHAVLLRSGQAGVEGQDLHGVRGVAAGLTGGDVPGAEVFRQRGRGVRDLALAGEEHEDVAGALGHELVGRQADGGELVDGVTFGSVVVLGDEGAVADLHGVCAPADLHDGGRPARPLDVTVGGRGDGVGGTGAEVRGETGGVDGGRRDDQLQVRAAGQQVGEVAEEEVDVEGALVGLVDDDRVVAGEQRIALDLGEEDAVRHELDQRVPGDEVGEAHLVADGPTQLDAELLRDALRDRPGGDAAGLGVADQAGDAAAQFEADLGDLGGLARPGLAGDDHDLVVADGGGDLRAPGRDRQFLRVRDGGDGGGPGGQLGRGAAANARAAVARARGGALGRDVFRHVSNCEASRGRSGGGRANVSLASAFAVDAS